MPSRTLTVRRLHDSNKCGCKILLGLIAIAGGIIQFVLAVLEAAAVTFRGAAVSYIQQRIN